MTVNARPALLLTNIASIAVGFALFAVLIGTANFVEAPPAAGYGFGSAILVGGFCLLPSGLFMLVLSPVSARISALFGPKVALALGAAVVAAGFLCSDLPGRAPVGDRGRHGDHRSRHRHRLRGDAEPDPAVRAAGRAGRRQRAELPRPDGRLLLASALGGTVLTSQTITLAGYAYPALAAYRTLFAICAAAALAGAAIALVIPISSHSAQEDAGRHRVLGVLADPESR